MRGTQACLLCSWCGYMSAAPGAQEAVTHAADGRERNAVFAPYVLFDESVHRDGSTVAKLGKRPAYSSGPCRTLPTTSAPQKVQLMVRQQRGALPAARSVQRPPTQTTSTPWSARLSRRASATTGRTAPPPPPSRARRSVTLVGLARAYLPRETGSKPDTAVTAATIKPSTTPPATSELIRFFSDGVTPACAASGLASTAPIATVTAAGSSTLPALQRARGTRVSLQTVVQSRPGRLCAHAAHLLQAGPGSPGDHWRACGAADCGAGGAAHCAPSGITEFADGEMEQARPSAGVTLCRLASGNMLAVCCCEAEQDRPRRYSPCRGCLPSSTGQVRLPGTNPRPLRSSSGRTRAGARPPPAGSLTRMQQPSEASLGDKRACSVCLQGD